MDPKPPDDALPKLFDRPKVVRPLLPGLLNGVEVGFVADAPNAAPNVDGAELFADGLPKTLGAAGLCAPKTNGSRAGVPNDCPKPPDAAGCPKTGAAGCPKLGAAGCPKGGGVGSMVDCDPNINGEIAGSVGKDDVMAVAAGANTEAACGCAPNIFDNGWLGVADGLKLNPIAGPLGVEPNGDDVELSDGNGVAAAAG
jgi:hypothetical protein